MADISYYDNVREVGPWQGKDWKENFGDINPVGTMRYLRMFFKGIIEISEDLKVDEDRRAKWQHILDNLSPIPTKKVDGRLTIVGAEGGTGSGSRMIGASPMTMWKLLFPLSAFDRNVDPSLMKILQNDADLWGDQQWNHAHSGGFEIIFSSSVRLGMNPEFILDKLSKRLVNGGYPNLWVPSTGGGIETLNAVPASINEMLLQSHEGIIRLFPNWVKEKNSEFKTLRAMGAFLVSSKLKDARVQFVEIISEKGRQCTIENTWGDVEVLLERNGKKGETLSGDLLRFNTEKNEKIFITPILL